MKKIILSFTMIVIAMCTANAQSADSLKSARIEKVMKVLQSLSPDDLSQVEYQMNQVAGSTITDSLIDIEIAKMKNECAYIHEKIELEKRKQRELSTGKRNMPWNDGIQPYHSEIDQRNGCCCPKNDPFIRYGLQGYSNSPSIDPGIVSKDSIGSMQGTLLNVPTGYMLINGFLVRL